MIENTENTAAIENAMEINEIFLHCFYCTQFRCLVGAVCLAVLQGCQSVHRIDVLGPFSLECEERCISLNYSKSDMWLL